MKLSMNKRERFLRQRLLFTDDLKNTKMVRIHDGNKKS